MIEAYGAHLELTPGAGTDIDLALARMRELVAAEPDRYFFPGEFENPDNPEAQQRSGDEIWEQMDGRVDVVVAAQGTGGWITGVTRALKANDATVLALSHDDESVRWIQRGFRAISLGSDIGVYVNALNQFRQAALLAKCEVEK